MFELAQTFNFVVTLTRGETASGSGAPDLLGTGGFQECSGLELEADIKEYLEGGRNDGVIRRVGRVKLQPLVLKRGMFIADDGYVDDRVWQWLQSMVAGILPVPRYDGSIQVKAPDRRRTGTVARWTFERGLPMKVTGPALNGKTGDIAVEELHIAHEGLRLESGRS
ncbi:phage tail protein [Actinoplanes solisilvae]|uniref:phage tail protein n=1 Tax=Actinoplanes solisilvae TaxID=2486853 RepID=UPI000FD7154F|nr:phage tail protein [Actinoplanes solisilvae]